MTNLDRTQGIAAAGDTRLAATATRPKMSGTAMLLLAALAWGVGNVAQKTILDHLDAFAANGITCLLGAAVLYPFARREASAPAKGSGSLLLMVAISFTIA